MELVTLAAHAERLAGFFRAVELGEQSAWFDTGVERGSSVNLINY